VYTSSTTPDSFELRAEAALAALPLGALSHLAAARVLAFGLDEESVEISVPPGTRNRLAGVRIHQSPLPGHHVIRRGGFRLTNVERTLVDLGKVPGPTKLHRNGRRPSTGSGTAGAGSTSGTPNINWSWSSTVEDSTYGSLRTRRTGAANRSVCSTGSRR
jgi:hypothetical protein